MAGRSPHQDQFEDERPKRGVLWAIFFMPGAALLWMQYKFPSKGDVLASARRYGDPVVEFLYTMMIYGGLAVAAYVLPQLQEGPAHGNKATETVAADTLYSDDDAAEPALAGDVIVAAPEPPPEPVSDEAPTYAPPDAEELAASPPEDPPY